VRIVAGVRHTRHLAHPLALVCAGRERGRETDRQRPETRDQREISEIEIEIEREIEREIRRSVEVVVGFGKLGVRAGG
jgi:hypothetical protein